MGRTLPTFNTYLEQEIAQWAPFRRALRREDRASFDRLFALVKRHMAEAANAARPVPFDALVMSILLEQQKALEGLAAKLDGAGDRKGVDDVGEVDDVSDVNMGAMGDSPPALSPPVRVSESDFLPMVSSTEATASAPHTPRRRVP